MQLRRSDVLNGALELLDSDGLDALTMRKLAAHLGVQAGSLYWHFANKRALLEAMADAIVAGAHGPELQAPTGTEVGWDEQVSDLARALRRALLSRRDGGRVVAGTYVTDAHTLAAGRQWYAALLAAGLPAASAGWVGFTLFSYVLGHSIDEQGVAELTPAQRQAKTDVALAEESARDIQMLVEAADADPLERFEYGLSLFLDGLRHQLQGQSR